ncbi:ABC transporter permease [Paraburkholderia susongensis]|uniref:Putative spermidine/putrescine transport system permease protein/mannopine transport system permease protein n=1 Tax=Paraburkholderia susongensis TaxID=1515439 RepID=A0A1X7JET7_9BURK|nr:ABC transporter permease [Paraburkholderia susongensis]SMG26389.1 putative spermidine/putrescine transport system permease protein/mannopine transport system permease protein [Paraburkholderia susongensis]
MARVSTDSEFRAWSIGSGYRWLIVPPAAFLLCFFVWPLVRVIARSFGTPGLGLGNYRHVISAGPYLKVLANTFETAAFVAAICLLIAYPVAYAITRARGWRLQLMSACVIIPLWTSVVIRSYAWMVVFQRAGVLNGALVWSGLVAQPVDFVPGAIASNVGMVHIMLPFMVLPLIACMRAIDPSLLRAAGVLGANPAIAFARVFLPLSMPGVSAGSLLVFMMSLGFFVTPALLGGPRNMMAAVLIEQQTDRYLQWGIASAFATLLLLLTMAIYIVYVRLTGGATQGFDRER